MCDKHQGRQLIILASFLPSTVSVKWLNRKRCKYINTFVFKLFNKRNNRKIQERRKRNLQMEQENTNVYFILQMKYPHAFTVTVKIIARYVSSYEVTQMLPGSLTAE